MKPKFVLLSFLLFLAFVAVIICPPWSIYGPMLNTMVKTTFAGWYFIWSPPPFNEPIISPYPKPRADSRFSDLVPRYPTANSYERFQIDYPMIALELVPLVVLTLIFLVFYSRQPRA